MWKGAGHPGQEHYGLEKVKERILEFIAVRRLNPRRQGQDPMPGGPSGRGQDLHRHLRGQGHEPQAGALCLGGVRDEADIRGHRKTYIGAMPAASSMAEPRRLVNPLLLLDEIDKLGSDYAGRSGIGAAGGAGQRAEHAFRDHFLEMPVDLSRVMFITTANRPPFPARCWTAWRSSSCPAIRTRKSCRSPGHLLPKQMKNARPAHAAPRGRRGAMRTSSRLHPRSAVPAPERCSAELCRKAAMLLERDVKQVRITEETSPNYLGTPRYTPDDSGKRRGRRGQRSCVDAGRRRDPGGRGRRDGRAAASWS